jgi:hypothetical protein
MMGERDVKHSLMAAARSRMQPTMSNDIVSAEDPTMRHIQNMDIEEYK